MSRIEVTGLDELMARYNAAGGQLRPIIEDALRKSGEALAEELRAQEARFKAPTGELGRTIRLSDPWHHASASGIYQNYEGSYAGSRGGGERAGSRGRRAAFVAAMQEHTNKHPFNRRARRKAAVRINAILAEALGDVNRALEGGGGGL